MTALANHNKTVTTALVDVRNAVAARADLYEDDQTGLKSKFQQAKAAVASQRPAREHFRSSAGVVPSTRPSRTSAIEMLKL